MCLLNAVTYKLLFWYNRLHKRNIFIYPECLNCRRLCSISYASVSMQNFLLVLTILAPYSSSSLSPPTGCILRCSFSTRFSHPSLSLRQGTAVDTPHKHPLQSDYCRLLDLKFLDEKLKNSVINDKFWCFCWLHIPQKH